MFIVFSLILFPWYYQKKQRKVSKKARESYQHLPEEEESKKWQCSHERFKNIQKRLCKNHKKLKKNKKHNLVKKKIYLSTEKNTIKWEKTLRYN